MKKKGQPIPDFSRNRKGTNVPGAPDRKQQPAPRPQKGAGKPQATSSKSGHRGK
ncbi:MAG: hypothetical protein H0T21_01685 [Gemmatimonadaceae bacterium]|nr:hypothetical protein [Gemmatimonadaceae bacterium]